MQKKAKPKRNKVSASQAAMPEAFQQQILGQRIAQVIKEIDALAFVWRLNLIEAKGQEPVEAAFNQLKRACESAEDIYKLEEEHGAMLCLMLAAAACQRVNVKMKAAREAENQRIIAEGAASEPVN